MDTYDPNKEPINVLASLILRVGFIVLILLAVCGLLALSIAAPMLAAAPVLKGLLAVAALVVFVRYGIRSRKGRRP